MNEIKVVKTIVRSKASVQCSVLLSLFFIASAVSLAQKPELVVQTGHSDWVNSLAFSVDGKTFASGSADQTIKLWQITGRELRVLRGHSSSIKSVGFSIDGNTLGSGSVDGVIKLWDVATGRELRTLLGPSSSIESIAFSGDGKMLASGSADHSIKLWEVSTGKELPTLVGHSDQVWSVAFSADGKTLASGSGHFEHTIKLWEVATGRELRTLVGHSGGIFSVALSRDGKTLASGSDDATVKLWNVATGRQLRTLKGHSHRVHSVAFSGDGKTLASGSADETVKLWNVSTGRELHTLPGHVRAVFTVAFSVDGKTLASGSFDQTIKLWEAATGRELRTLRGHSGEVRSVAISGDGKMLASGNVDLSIKLWQGIPGRELQTLRHSGEVSSVEFSRDGKTLASGSENGEVKLWEVSTGLELYTLSEHTSSIHSIAFSGDGKTLASGSWDQTIKLWDVATGNELRTLVGHSGGIFSVALSRDGKTLASGSANHVIKLWEVATGHELHSFTAHSDTVNSVTFSGDGKTLASGGSDGDIKLWEVTTAREIRKFKGHSDSVNSVAISADGQTLASAGSDKTVRLWEVSTGRQLRKLIDHTHEVSSVAFSANGSFLVSGGRDATTKLWRVDGGELMASLIALDDTDWAVVAPDGPFDASPGAQRMMHWMVRGEPIELEQLKERYYEPHLLAKILNNESLRDVTKFENPKLNPALQYEAPPKGSSTLVVSLTNRGGGIGRVQVFVNDKEFLSDARDDNLKQNPHVSQATLNIDLSTAPGTVSGEENQIRVLAWNVENYISSRGDEKPWVAPGPASKEKPEVYAIVGGISHYAGSRLKLSYAATDAVAIANAIELGAKRLFGADKVHLKLLTTANDPRAIPPTKANFNEAFRAVQLKAKAKDILIVYLAGHAITFKQAGSDTYCYLTREAESTDVSDPEVRKQRTVTSDDLRDWIKLIAANKQAVMLDTCAAGAAQEQFIALARAGSGDAIRAIELAMDRTGSHFLMGSAADAEAFETSQYGQGLLTYALLKGIKGEALDDAGMVDVNTLFRFAREEVEKLAKNIDKIQKPKISAAKGDTFPVGRLTREDAEKIVLAKQKPMILRPNFQESQTFGDPLDLMKNLRELLRDETATELDKGEAPFGFSNTEDFPGGIKPVGRYDVEGDKVTMDLRLQQDKAEVFSTRVVGTKADIASKVIAAIKAVIKKL